MVTRYIGKDAWVNAVAHEVGPGVTINSKPGEHVVMLPCTVCHVEKEYLISKRFPPVVIRKKLEEFGWRTGKHLTCPGCVKTRPNAHKKIVYDLPEVSTELNGEHPAYAAPATKAPPCVKLTEAAAPQTASIPTPPAKVDSLAQLGQLISSQKLPSGQQEHTPSMPTFQTEVRPPRRPVINKVRQPATPAAAAKAPPLPTEAPVTSHQLDEVNPSPAARAARRKMLHLLEDYFDHESGRYRSDSKGQPYDDKRVARESGVSLEYVRKERTKWFAPLREPEEYEILRELVGKLEERIQRIESDAKAAAEQLRGEVRALRAEMESVCQKQGWLA